jgi:hypothetical protein
MPREADNRLTATHHNATIGVTQLPPLSRQPFKRSFVPLCHPDSPQFNTLLDKVFEKIMIVEKSTRLLVNGSA